jgi:CheY-like chemotaxis protein
MTSLSPVHHPVTSGKPAGASPLRVLYADDMEELRVLMGFVMAREGHQLEACKNGETALALLRAAPDRCDLLITDHHMPVMNGLELVRRTRGLPYAGKIVVFSSELNPSVQAEYLALRVDRVLAKPVLPGELRQVLHELFPPA